MTQYTDQDIAKLEARLENTERTLAMVTAHLMQILPPDMQSAVNTAMQSFFDDNVELGSSMNVQIEEVSSPVKIEVSPLRFIIP